MRIVFETDKIKIKVNAPDGVNIYELTEIVYDILKGLTYSDEVILKGLNKLIQERQ